MRRLLQVLGFVLLGFKLPQSYNYTVQHYTLISKHLFKYERHSDNMNFWDYVIKNKYGNLNIINGKPELNFNFYEKI